MRTLLITLASTLTLASCSRLQLPPFLTNAHAVLYGFSDKSFFPEANLTLTYDVETACLHFKTVVTYRPDLTTEFSQCQGLETFVSSNTLSCVTKP